MYPGRDTIKQLYMYSAQVTTECDQSMVESGATNCRQTLPVFTFMNKRGNTNMEPYKLKSNDFQSYPRRDTAAGGGKRCR